MSIKNTGARTARAILLAATIALLQGATALAADSGCEELVIPAAAQRLGLTKLVIDSCPGLDDVSTDGRGHFPWYSGHQWRPPGKQPKRDSYAANEQGQLVIKLGGSIAAVSRMMKPGKFPLLSGAKPFYVEFTYKLSSQDQDHFPAVWMMPVEHARGQPDHYAGDPPRFQRWFELDVDEGGFTKGFMGTALSWSGVFPGYKRVRSNPRWDVPPLDRSQINTFAAAYQPDDLKVTWWLNGKEQYSAGPPAVPEIARLQNFYPIIGVASRGKNIPYEMTIIRIRAFVAE